MTRLRNRFLLTMLGIMALTFVVIELTFPGNWKSNLFAAVVIVVVLGWPIAAIFLPRSMRKAKRKDYFGEE